MFGFGRSGAVWQVPRVDSQVETFPLEQKVGVFTFRFQLELNVIQQIQIGQR